MLEVFTSALAAGVSLFAVTNIDDLAVLLGFLADRRIRARHVVVGQFLGMAALVAVSVVAARASLVLPMPFVGLLGLIPIALGIRELARNDDESEEEAAALAERSSGWGVVLAVAAVTIANGGDNIGVYTPVFALRSPAEMWALVLIFALMTVIWCIAAHWLVNHRTFGLPVRKFGQALLPYVLIAIGIWVIFEADTVSLLR